MTEINLPEMLRLHGLWLQVNSMPSYSGPAIGPASPNAVGGSTVAPNYNGPSIGPAW